MSDDYQKSREKFIIEALKISPFTDEEVNRAFEEFQIDQKERKEIRKLQEELKAKQDKRDVKVRIRIDSYMHNVNEFYDKQPFFYDDSGIFWFWKDNRYEQVDDVDVMNMLDETLGFEGQTVSGGLKTNYLEAFKRVGRKHKPREAPAKWVQFNDVAYSLNSGKTYPVQPNYFFTNPIPWDIGTTLETPTMDKLITEWVGEEYRQTAYEIIAYCCLADYPIHLIFCLVGSGRNGKSKFLGLIHNFLGADNICSTELDSLLSSRFEGFKLYKKLACIMGETNFNVLNKTSLLKKLTGQDLIGFEKKNKTPFDAKNYAKILIASNSLPVSTDTSEGFYRRWMIINFNNIFKEGHDVLQIIPEGEYNALAKKVTEVLPKLLKAGEFNKQGSIEERQQKYILASNPLSHFLEISCERGADYFMRYSELYTAYRQYLHKNKRRRILYKEFNDVLALEGLEVIRTTKKIGEDWVSDRYIEGIKLKVHDTYDTYDRFSNSFHAYEERSIKISHKSHKCHETQDIPSFPMETVKDEPELIHHPCCICGSEPSHYWTKTGRPICQDCFKAHQAQNSERLNKLWD